MSNTGSRREKILALERRGQRVDRRGRGHVAARFAAADPAAQAR
jgi:hypothetical protein